MAKSSSQPVIVWFRQDLRLEDNPALYYAAQQGQVLPVFIRENHPMCQWPLGGASRCWLHHALKALQKDCAGRLIIQSGDPSELLAQIAYENNAQAIYWNRRYEPHNIQKDCQIKQALQDQGLSVKSFKASLLIEPWENLKGDQTPYRVFTPFYRQAIKQMDSVQTLAYPKALCWAESNSNSLSVEKLELLPKQNWHQSLCGHWDISAKGAQKRLQDFVQQALLEYQVARDRPDKQGVSYLSPYLNFGQISPQQIWQATYQQELTDSVAAFQRQLIWREFSYHVLYYFPSIPAVNFKSKFDNLPWRDDKTSLERWQMGETGVPIVDAGMRQLWQTGYMHNRLRMIVGSFLVKNLLIHWRHGENWFWDTLFDADLANNSLGWQWVAGTGLDAAPYFRIFNPVTQGEKFDPDGCYTRYYVPELKNLPNRYLMKPWQASQTVLNQANIKLGYHYPEPLVDLKESRKRALDAFHRLS